MSISEEKFNESYKDLTSFERKVLDATPMQAAWTSSQIFAELKRRGINQPMKGIEGALNSMKNSGLVIITDKPVKFMRVEVRLKAKPQSEVHSQGAVTVQPLAEQSPLKKIDSLISVAKAGVTALNQGIEALELHILEQDEANEGRNEADKKQNKLIKSLMSELGHHQNLHLEKDKFIKKLQEENAILKNSSLENNEQFQAFLTFKKAMQVAG